MKTEQNRTQNRFGHFGQRNIFSFKRLAQNDTENNERQWAQSAPAQVNVLTHGAVTVVAFDVPSALPAD